MQKMIDCIALHCIDCIAHAEAMLCYFASSMLQFYDLLAISLFMCTYMCSFNCDITRLINLFDSLVTGTALVVKSALAS